MTAGQRNSELKTVLRSGFQIQRSVTPLSSTVGGDDVTALKRQIEALREELLMVREENAEIYRLIASIPDMLKVALKDVAIAEPATPKIEIEEVQQASAEQLEKRKSNLKKNRW